MAAFLQQALQAHQALKSTWASEILDSWLYLGSGWAAEDIDALRKFKITHILNVADDVQNFYEDLGEFKYVRLDVKDMGQDEGISRVFERAYEFVTQAREASGRVLVHCAAGVNRSATVTIALLMMLESLPLRDAVRRVRSKRNIMPFKDNKLQLIAWEQTRTGASTLTLEEFEQIIETKRK